MKILLDLLYIMDEEPSGIKKYGFKLANDFKQYYNDVTVGVICRSNMLPFIQGEIGKEYSYILIDDDELKSLHNGYAKFRIKYSIKSLQIESYTYVISTCANYPVALFSPFVKHIGVVHDLQMLKLMWKNRNVLRSIYQFFDTRRRIRKLDYIITISNHTRLSVKRFAHRDSKVIYYALEPPTLNECKPNSFPFSNNETYILDVNTFYKYKNADTLLKAFSKIHLKYPNYRLYFKGNYCKEYERLPLLAKKLGVTDKVHFDLNLLTEEEMSWLYTNASIFVTPSMMEGFGATPIEAITHETPVISSNIDTLKEVVRDCAVFFSPKNVDELVSLLEKEIEAPTSIDVIQNRKNFMLELYSRKTQVDNYYSFLKSL